jgi:diacylglycerol kinase family enzyme
LNTQRYFRRPSWSYTLRICCIINDHAGAADKALLNRVGPLFASHGISPDILYPQKGKSIIDLARQAVERGCEIVVAGGGDGTVNAVATALVDTSKRLGILPMGTLNHFAKDLKIPLDLQAAVQIIVAGRNKFVDVGEVNDRIFVNNSSLGLYPSIVRLRKAMERSGESKWRALSIATLKIFTQFPRLKFELRSDAASLVRFVTPLLFVGNNKYEITLTHLGGRNALDAGKLWVVIPSASTRWQLALDLLALVRGRGSTADVFSFETENLIVDSKQRAREVAVDGEVLLLRPPLHYRIRPRSLQVIVPAG